MIGKRLKVRQKTVKRARKGRKESADFMGAFSLLVREELQRIMAEWQEGDRVGYAITMAMPEQRKYKSYKEEILAELADEIIDKDEIEAILEGAQKLPVILSREECLRLMNAFREGAHAFRNNLVIRLLYATGIRGQELADLQFCDITYEAKTIFVRGGKGDKDRYVCADEKTFAMLREWQQGKKLEDKVIGVGVRQIRRIVEEAGELVGLQEKFRAMGREYATHSLRRAFATHCYENGMRVLTLKKLLGHENLGTTMMYLFTAMKYDVEEYERTGHMRE